MNKIIMVAVLSLSASLASQGYAADEHTHGHDNHAGAVSLQNLTLNNGKRWQMDEHTRTMSEKMEKTFFDADHSTQASLNALGAELETQIQELVAGCTMEGKAHDQLHVFLNDHIPTITAMVKADSLESARTSAIQLKGQFETYRKHFQ